MNYSVESSLSLTKSTSVVISLDQCVRQLQKLSSRKWNNSSQILWSGGWCLL